jgi:hypothetical protein
MAKTREERIRDRAYEIWQREGAEHGRHADHWLRAEAEIEAEDRKAAATGQQSAAIAREAGATGTAPPPSPTPSRVATPARAASKPQRGVAETTGAGNEKPKPGAPGRGKSS